jgi:hypothetical protein
MKWPLVRRKTLEEAERVCREAQEVARIALKLAQEAIAKKAINNADAEPIVGRGESRWIN